MAQHLAAIDVGTKSVRVAVIRASVRRAELAQVSTVQRQADEEAAAFWSRVRAVLPASIDALIVTVDGAAASTRLISFPFDDLRRVEAAVPFELENLVPYELDEVATAWSIARRSAGTTDVLAALTPRAGLLAQIDELRAAQLEPRVSILPAAALSEFASHESEGPAAVVALGEVHSHLAVVGHGLRYARTLKVGGADVDRAIAKAYGITVDQAKTAKEREGQIVGDEGAVPDDVRRLSEAVRSGLLPFVRELSMSLKALPAEALPTRLLLTGGASRLPGLAAHLERHLGIPVALIDLKAQLGPLVCVPEALGPEYGLAVAAALSLYRRGRRVPINFRQGDLAYRGDLQLYRSELIRIGIGAAAVIVLAIAGAIVRYTVMSAEEAQLNQRFCETTKRIIGQEICDPVRALATMRMSPAGAGVVVPPYSAAALFEMLSQTIDTTLDVSFDELEIRVDGRADEPDRVTARGEAASFETTEQLVSKLQSHPCVSEAEASKQKKTRDNSRVEFSLAVKVRCPPGVKPHQTVEASAVPAAAVPAGEAIPVRPSVVTPSSSEAPVQLDRPQPPEGVAPLFKSRRGRPRSPLSGPNAIRPPPGIEALQRAGRPMPMPPQGEE